MSKTNKLPPRRTGAEPPQDVYSLLLALDARMQRHLHKLLGVLAAIDKRLELIEAAVVPPAPQNDADIGTGTEEPTP